LNKRMIDLANRLEPNFLRAKNLGCYFVWSYFTQEKRKGAWEEKKYEIVLVLLFRIRHRMQAYV
jgi:hypothetical protein